MLSWNWCPTCSNCSEGRRSTPLPSRSSMLRPVSLTLLCGLLAAQQTTPPTAPPAQSADQPGQPQFTIRTDYVTTPVLVFDRDGGYVNGLRPDQFRLFDNQKEQNITA